ncbi:DNA-processing protein DprA [Vibrio nigripulchritudo]|uniref:DNA-processing protein DprA n=1 Tax=Vibrio nigripulchritudo TaxID=28173 RepID=UPI0005F9FD1A|nr:DNA-processing protein DprA [Vibrio nigripulchritudo]KJY70303.1 DNA processing protein DprA [Vibrio nigripulchritudo]
MTNNELRAWLTLSFTPQLGGQSLTRLLAIDSPVNILSSGPERWQAIGLKPKQIAYLQAQSHPEVEESLEWGAASDSHHILTLLDTDYPPLLKEVPSPPTTLFVKGDVSSLSAPQIAMVGSRNASIEGLQTAKSFAKDLSGNGLVVTSGLALGVDGYAHDGALEGGGKTVAVLGSGLECIYPARHRKLASRVIEQGALVSEFRPNTKPRPEHFPRRNRIISGLSVGVFVVEAAERSGSLITARYAAEQGRDVFALPGSIHNPNARGGNALIKSGACLVQSSQDILQEVENLVSWSFSQQTSIFSEEAEQEELPFPELMANVGIEATPVDILAERTHIPVHEVMMQLLELELSGHIVAVPGGYIRKGRG